MPAVDQTDLKQLMALSDWLSDDNELPSSGDAACVSDSIEEIEFLRALVVSIHKKLEYGDVFQWDDGDPCWEEMRKLADDFEGNT